MHFKSLFLAAVVSFIGVSTVMAQGPGGGPGGPPPGGEGGGPGGPMMSADAFKEKLQLTDEQAKKLQALLDELKKIFESMRGKDLSDESTRKAAFEKIDKQRDEIMAKAKDFLSADQYKKLTEMMKPPRPSEQ